MDKIFLLDKRTSRQQRALTSAGLDINTLDNIEGLINYTGNNSTELINKIRTDDFSELNEFKLLVFHDSDLEYSDIDRISKFCSRSNKDLILFSGGIRQNIYNNNGFDKMLINSANLYTSQLKTFCENYIAQNTNHLTELLYGKTWDLNYALIYRQLLIDQLNGDDFVQERTLKKKKELLKTCESILGKKNIDELNLLIEEKIIML